MTHYQLVEINIDHEIAKETKRGFIEITEELTGLKELMLELNGMVGVQGEQLQEIEQQVEVSKNSVEQGTIDLNITDKILAKEKKFPAKIIAIIVAGVGILGTAATALLFLL